MFRNSIEGTLPVLFQQGVKMTAEREFNDLAEGYEWLEMITEGSIDEQYVSRYKRELTLKSKDGDFTAIAHVDMSNRYNL